MKVIALNYRCYLAKLILVTSIAFWPAVAFAACSVSDEEFPSFEFSVPTLPDFKGRQCSLDDWRMYHDELLDFRFDIGEFDDRRVRHDFDVREFDKALERARLSRDCDYEEYERMRRLVALANRENSGPRKDVWLRLQTELSEALRYVQSNRESIAIDTGGQCEGVLPIVENDSDV